MQVIASLALFFLVLLICFGTEVSKIEESEEDTPIESTEPNDILKALICDSK